MASARLWIIGWCSLLSPSDAHPIGVGTSDQALSYNPCPVFQSQSVTTATENRVIFTFRSMADYGSLSIPKALKERWFFGCRLAFRIHNPTQHPCQAGGGPFVYARSLRFGRPAARRRRPSAIARTWLSKITRRQGRSWDARTDPGIRSILS